MIPASAIPWINALSGRSVAGYTIGGCIGAGAFGMVFAVVREDTGTEFAMKSIRRTPIRSVQLSSRTRVSSSAS